MNGQDSAVTQYDKEILFNNIFSQGYPLFHKVGGMTGFVTNPIDLNNDYKVPIAKENIVRNMNKNYILKTFP